MSGNGEKTISDAELHALLKKYEPDYKEEKLTEGQRKIRLQRLEKHQKKEKEENEKQARKRERETLKSPASVIPAAEVSPPAKKGRGAATRGMSVTESVATNSNVTLQLTPVKSNQKKNDKVVTVEDVMQSPKSCGFKGIDITTRGEGCIEVMVIDTVLGQVAANLPLTLYGLDKDKSWKLLAERRITSHGDCPGLITKDLFQKGLYKIRLDAGLYYECIRIAPTFPYIEAHFEVTNVDKSYRLHIDMGPYSYTTSVNIVY